MTSLRQFVATLLRWIDSVAATTASVVGRLSFPRVVGVDEQEGGAFVVQPRAGSGKSAVPPIRMQFADGRLVASHPEQLATMLRGSRAELVLRSPRFMFRPLELPGRASEFLDGIVRAQIDRLTPWSAADAVFGWSKPVPAGADRIQVTVAATARAQVTPYLQALAGLGARSVSISTLAEDSSGGLVPIKVMDENARPVIDVNRVRRALIAVLLLSGLVAAGAVTAATVIAGNLGAQQDELTRRIAERRALIRAGGLGGEAAISTHGKLQKRKHETPSTVIVLEVLSQILPDHTYVTELRIEGDKLRLIGLTQDAPSLIRLIEQSPHFTRATFFAPTTRQPSDSGERFHIEARIEPMFSTRS
jgi:general secretion pathway protein L